MKKLQNNQNQQTLFVIECIFVNMIVQFYGIPMTKVSFYKTILKKGMWKGNIIAFCCYRCFSSMLKAHNVL